MTIFIVRGPGAGDEHAVFAGREHLLAILRHGTIISPAGTWAPRAKGHP